MAIATSTALIAGLAISAVGAGVSAYSQIQAGRDAKKLSEANAAMNNQAALDAARDSRAAANAQRRENDRLMSRQRALWAKAGVSASGGSPLLAQQEQAGQLEMQALEVERGGTIQAQRYRQQAQLDLAAGRSASRAGYLGAGSTVLSTAGNSLMSYAAYKK